MVLSSARFMLRSSIALLLAVALGLGWSQSRAAEEQVHGVIFEQWIRDTFFHGYKPRSYTQKWDIPADKNTEHGGIPANPKAAKYGTPVDMGDALRQFRVAEEKQNFLLIVGFWDQDGENKKWTNGVVAEVSPETYQKLWDPVTKEELEKLDAVVKDKSLSLEEARAQAQKIKSRIPFSKAIMQVNPKLDAKQRRLQCSIRFGDFFHYLAPNAESLRQDKPMIWGVPMPEEFKSPPRRRKKK
jgi:hypothetical protein